MFLCPKCSYSFNIGKNNIDKYCGYDDVNA